MKVIKLISQHIPIWSMLCGDHALQVVVNNINPKLISQPDFLNPLENKLRLDVFKDRRKWIWDSMGDNVAFALIEIDIQELLTFNTCFSYVSFEEFIKQYSKAYNKKKGFLIKRPRHNSDLEKNKEAVEYVCKNLANNIEASYSKMTYQLKSKNIVDPMFNNEKNIFLAANRSLLMKCKNNTIKIMDGTHRLTAYAIAKTNKKCILPDRLYAFYWEEA
jgi:hypothetical protein